MAITVTRKDFLRSIGLGAAALFCNSTGYCFPGYEDHTEKGIKGHVFRGEAPKSLWKWSKEGFYYATEGSTVQCLACPNQCVLEPGDRSICRSKVNIGGKLYSLTYGNPCAVHIDPIEKKPLNHFYPGSLIFSIATTGCNFRCLNCQNWEISQKRPEEVRHTELFPEDVVHEAKKRTISAIAYTYSEPTTFFEYMFDTARLAREEGMKNVLISNGYMNQSPLFDLSKYIDAANINLKSFEDPVYLRLNGGRLKPVLDTLKTLHREGVWFEMTTLVVPTYVDKPDMIKRMCGWILSELGPDYPLHLLRFFPRYKLTRLPATPVLMLEELRRIATSEGIHYVYIGNVPGHKGNYTSCHNCHKVIIERKGYFIAQYNLKDGRCRFCNTRIPGRWE